MPTVHPIDEPTARRHDSPSQDKTANNNKAALPGTVSHLEKELIIMNTKLLYPATLIVALLASGAAMASEATQVDVAASTQSRAEVKAELHRAIAAGEVGVPTAAYGNVVIPAASEVSRDQVRREAVAEARTGRVASRYIGS
jgi:hypothetical protein